MAQNKNNVAAERAAGASAGARQQKIPAAEINNVRSWMFEGLEIREVLHIDRLGADDVARVIEKLAEMTAASAKQLWVWVGGEDALTIKLTEHWKARIARDGAVIIKVSDYALVVDDRFLLLALDRDGFYVPVAKGDEITWDGTEEYLSPSDLRSLVKNVARRILEQTCWL